MTFKDVVIKNFKYNFKIYSSYFICSTFTITLFFIFTTLLYNKNVSAFFKEVGTGSDVVLDIGLISTFVFAIFFISYVHTSMKKSRSKEFALLMTLGMTSKELGRGIIIEDLILSAASLISGILVGTLFSRLVHMLINRIMDLHVPYNLSYKSFVLTFCSFFIIFTLVIVYGWIKTTKFRILKLLREQRKTEYAGEGSNLALMFGVILVAILVATSIVAIHNRDVALNFKITLPVIIFGLIGVYLLIANLFPKLLCFIKKRKSFYNKNMIMLTEVKYSMGKNKKLIYMSAILCTVIIYSFSSSLGLFSIVNDIVDNSKQADIEYIQAFNINNFKEQKISKLISEEKLKLKSKQNIKCLFLNVNGIKLSYKLPVIAISNSSFNKLSPKKTDIPKGKARLSGDIMNLPKAANDNSVNIQVGNSFEKLSLLEAEKLDALSQNMYLQHNFTLVLNDNDYNQVEAVLPKAMVGTIHRYKFDNDWRNTKTLFNKITALSRISKNNAEKILKADEIGKTVAGTLNISGKYSAYLLMKKLYSIFIFIFMFLALLFYVASVLMLFLRQFESLERTKRKYMQLRKIGITKKEFGKGIIGETRIIFLTPVVFGITLGYSFMLITEAMVGGSSLVIDFMKNAAVLTCIYIVLQIIACEWSGRRFLSRVIEE